MNFKQAESRKVKTQSGQRAKNPKLNILACKYKNKKRIDPVFYIMKQESTNRKPNLSDEFEQANIGVQAEFNGSENSSLYRTLQKWDLKQQSYDSKFDSTFANGNREVYQILKLEKSDLT